MAKMRLLTLLLLIIISSAFGFATTTIQCDNVKYAGEKLVFYSYSDPVSSATKLVFSLDIDKTGKCTTGLFPYNYHPGGFQKASACPFTFDKPGAKVVFSEKWYKNYFIQYKGKETRWKLL